MHQLLKKKKQKKELTVSIWQKIPWTIVSRNWAVDYYWSDLKIQGILFTIIKYVDSWNWKFENNLRNDDHWLTVSKNFNIDYYM